MIVSLARRASWLPAAALAVLFALVPASRAQQPLPPAFLEGTQIFRSILNRLKLTPFTKVEDLEEQPEKTILIVLGDPKTKLGAENLKTFVEKGGAVLFASDQAVSDVPLTSLLIDLTGYSISGSTVVGEPAPDFFLGRDAELPQRCYHDVPQCPYLVPAGGAGPNLLSLGGVREERELRLATNRPSYLARANSYTKFSLPLPALANLPEGCTPDLLGRLGGGKLRGLADIVKRISRLPGNTPVVVGGERDDARILLVADHSIFINMMLLSTDTGNVEFASNCLEYLRDPHGADRDRVLFLEEGQVNSNFNIPLKQIPGLSEQGLRALLASLNERLAHMEDHNVFDRGATDLLERRTTTSDVLQVTLILLTLGLLAWVVWRLQGTRGYRPETTVPLLAEATSTLVPGSLLEQRQSEILKSGNLWENARQAARQVFLSAGVAAPVGLLRPPLVKAAGGRWQRWRRRRQVLRLWRLAFDPRPSRVRPGAWPGLLVELEQLQADLANGSVQVENAV